MTSHPSFYRRYGKRTLDVGLAALALIVLAPVFLLAAVGVKLSGPGPVFYSQPRVGRDGKIFCIFKFRSMVAGADRLGPRITAAGDKRITTVGRFLRDWKLDELPQLWNVLRGEMSIVGPRPELPVYVKNYSEAQRRVLSERPGLTDLASIEYRNEETLLAAAQDRERFYKEVALPHKLALGCKYIEDISFLGDCQLVLRTMMAITGFGGSARQALGAAVGDALGQDRSGANGNS